MLQDGSCICLVIDKSSAFSLVDVDHDVEVISEHCIQCSVGLKQASLVSAVCV